MKTEQLEDILRPVSPSPHGVALKLASEYGSFLALAETEADDICRRAGANAQISVYIKLAVALASRRKCDLYRFGGRHTERETREYLAALFFGLSSETVYIISIDGDGKAIACDRVGEGSVNLSSVIPRKITETAIKRGAEEIIVAHNHPRGTAVASAEDIRTAESLNRICASVGICVRAHFVAARGECVRFM